MIVNQLITGASDTHLEFSLIQNVLSIDVA